MSNIEGIPEGWVIEHVSRFGEPGEHCVSPEGEPHLIVVRTIYRVCIIRKIENPKQHRAFANKAEYAPHRDRFIKLTIAESDGVYFTYRVASYDDWGVVFGGSKETYQSVFNRYVFDNLDGTTEPFGVEVQ